ncbi:MAG: hypothetical protein GXO85_01365 [Chlorobi bacterium]|nr:hypothetical protein [Chlorobiota bacterium]
MESLYREAYNDSLLNILISRHIKGSDSKNDSIKITAKNIDDDRIIDYEKLF